MSLPMYNNGIPHNKNFNGIINTIKDYEDYRNGKTEFKNIDKISHILIPKDLFLRLVELDKIKTANEKELIKKNNDNSSESELNEICCLCIDYGLWYPNKCINCEILKEEENKNE